MIRRIYRTFVTVSSALVVAAMFLVCQRNDEIRNYAFFLGCILIVSFAVWWWRMKARV